MFKEHVKMECIEYESSKVHVIFDREPVYKPVEDHIKRAAIKAYRKAARKGLSNKSTLKATRKAAYKASRKFKKKARNV